jgi:maleylpyruvate isomerase
VADLVAATRGLDRVFGRVRPTDWSREASYRGTATLLDVLVGEWRETELHLVDLGVGVTPSSWSAAFCAQLFTFLEPRVPPELTLEMSPVRGEPFRLGRGPQAVRVTGERCDLAAWLAGRPPVGPVLSSTGALPALRRLRDAAR